jgi:hypothetical protein
VSSESETLTTAHETIPYRDPDDHNFDTQTGEDKCSQEHFSLLRSISETLRCQVQNIANYCRFKGQRLYDLK